MREIKINPVTWYVGANDRKKHLFENNWPLPYGVSYNSYLINDRQTALIDGIEFGADPGYLPKIAKILAGKPLDYLIVNHMEPDHSGMIAGILEKYPAVKLVGNAQTQKILGNYYNIKADNFHLVADGAELSLGETRLRFHTIPWVHWPETMVTYDTTEKVLFSCDAFGGFGTLDGSIFDTGNDLQEHYVSEMRRYYSNIVGKYSGMVQKALAKLSGLEIKMICPSHGLVWKNPAEVVALYDKWSRYESEKEIVIAYASMYGNTEQMADFLGSMLGEKGYRVHTYDVSKTHVSYIMSMIWKCRAVLLGTCAYNGFMHPMMEHLCNEIKIAQPKEKIFGLFGSSTWNGAGVKSLSRFMHENGFPVLENTAEIAGSYAEEKMEEAGCALAAAVAESLK